MALIPGDRRPAAPDLEPHGLRIHRGVVSYETPRGQRHLSFRWCGSGPAWLLLHQGNMNATEMDALMRRWAGSGLLLAPDLPGWGGSSAVGPGTTIESIADAIELALTALGIDSVALYGTHTGALVATALAARHPARVRALATNGFVVGAPGSDEGLRMTEAIPWSASGAHLVTQWARVRDWMIFYPWFDTRRASRQTFPVPTAAFTHQVMLNQAEAEDPIASTRAVFTFDSLSALRSIVAPTRIMAFEADGTAGYVRRLRIDTPLPATVAVELVASEEHLWDAAHEFLQGHSSTAPDARLTRSSGSHSGLRPSYQRAQSGDLFAWASSASHGRPVVVLHDLGESSARHLALCGELAQSGPVLALDLPGHGRSAPVDGPSHFGEAWSAAPPRRHWDAAAVTAHLHEAIAGWLDSLEPVDNDTLREPREPVFIAFGLTSLLAAAYVAGRGLSSPVIAIDPPCPSIDELTELADRLFPDLAIDAVGSQWLRAWQIRRDGRIFWPWYATSPHHEPATEIRIRPGEIDREVLELLRGAGCARDLLAQLLHDAPPSVLRTTTIVATRGGASARQCVAAGLDVALWLPDDPAAAAVVIADYVRAASRNSSTAFATAAPRT